MTNKLARTLEAQQDAAYALLRVLSGFMFSIHGVQKVLGLLAERAQPAIGSQLWVGGLIELVCGVLIAVGAFTRYAAFLASGTMAVAYAQFHWEFAFDERFFPAVNHGELAAVYALLFFFVACKGGGRFAIDQRLAR